VNTTLLNLPFLRLSLEETGEITFGVAVALLSAEAVLALGPVALFLEIGRE
jgi:hypothetical protein